MLRKSTFLDKIKPYLYDLKGYNVKIHTLKMVTNMAIVSQDLAALAEEIILQIIINYDLLIMITLGDKSLFPNRWSRSNNRDFEEDSVMDSNLQTAYREQKD